MSKRIDAALRAGLDPQGPSGGNGGKFFSERVRAASTRIKKVRVWSGSQIDAIQLVAKKSNGDLSDGFKYGGSGGKKRTITLTSSEFIYRIYGRYGSVVDSLSILLSSGRLFTFGGSGGNAEFFYTAPSNCQITGLVGRHGARIDAIGVHIRQFK